MRWGLRAAGVVAMAYALVLGVSQAYAYATASSRFEVRVMQFRPTEHVGEERLRALLALEPGTNILSLDLPTLAERIEQDPWVVQAKVERELPDTLHIELVEHDPKAVLHAGSFFFVDETGLPFKRVERGERGDLPIVTGLSASALLKDPAAARARIRAALSVLDDYVTRPRPELGEINVDDTGFVTLYTRERGTALRLGRSDLSAALARFDAVRGALGAKSDELAVVHLDGRDAEDEKARVIVSFLTSRLDSALLAEASKAPETAGVESGAPIADAPVQVSSVAGLAREVRSSEHG